MNQQALSAFIWSVADLLRGDYRQSEYGNLYDPTAGTGGMLSIAEEYLVEHNPQARLNLHGQELNDESYAICKADMLIKGQDVANIKAGNTLSNDGHRGLIKDKQEQAA